MARVVRALLACACVTLLLPAAAPAAAGKPVVSAFYYPWYGTPRHDGAYVHWTQNGHSPPGDIASNFYPARGPYSSADPAVIRSDMSQIKAAGIDEVVVSWWGRGSAEDKRLPALLAAAKRKELSAAVHIEPYTGRSPATVGADIGYLRDLGIRRFYVYRPLDFPSDDWLPVNDALTGVQVFAQTVFAGWAAHARFDGIYTYDILTYGGDKFARLCAQARKRNLLCLPSVGPGFDARRATPEQRVKPRRNGTTYDSMWKAAIAAKADGVTITSYNEWHEGTQIEPASASVGPPYLSYEGAWNSRGPASRNAYLERTAYWAKQFRLAPQ